MGTLTLLLTSPITEVEVVIGKFISAFLFLALLILMTIYMPLLIFVNGKVSFGHILSGYLGLLLLGGACLSIGLFGSVIAKNQLLAVIISAALIVALLLFWLLGAVTEPPIRDVVGYLAIHGKHFINFQRGVIHSRDVLFYFSTIYMFLLLTTHMLQARRWR